MAFIKRNYDDTPVREFGIKFIKENMGYAFISHPNKFAIDLISCDNSDFGAEMEAGGWEGDFWTNKKYSLISNLGFETINIPIRKTKYWYDNVNESYVPNKKKHIFIRTNKDFTQAIVIKPTTIKNKSKIIWSTFKANNNDEVENWMSFKKTDVDTYDFENGKWVLQK